MYLATQFQAAKVGDFSLAGAQVKFSMKEVPVLICNGEIPVPDSPFDYEACPWKLEGTIEDGQAVFQRP